MNVLKLRVISSLIGVTSLFSVATPQAALFTVGDLTYNDTTKIISGNGKEYLGFGVGVDWTYAETLAATSSGGGYADFDIANTAEADFFIGSLFGSSSDSCSATDGVTISVQLCGNITGWTDDILGSSYTSNADAVWFIADEGGYYNAGDIVILASGDVIQEESLDTFTRTDMFSASGNFSDISFGWLLVRSSLAEPVTEPSILSLMGLGIFGLGLSRRKMKK